MAKPVPPRTELDPELPERKAYAVERKGDGWVTVFYTLRGDRVVSRLETTMDARAICEQRVVTEMGRD